MGLNYTGAVVLYNRFYNDTLETEYFLSTRFEGVRIELTQADNITKSGIKDADIIKVKIPQNAQTKAYKSKPEWDNLTLMEKQECFTVDAGNNDFFVIEQFGDLGINETDLPEGVIDSEEYAGGFYQYMKENHNTYTVKTLDVFNLIPRLEIGGA